MGGAVIRFGKRSPSSTAATSSDDIDRYEQVRSELLKVRDTARELSHGLDEVSISREILDSVREELGFDSAALYGISSTQRLLPLAVVGADRIDYAPRSGDERWNIGLYKGRVAYDTGSFTDDSTGCAAVMPMLIDSRIIAVIGVEKDEGEWSGAELTAAARVLEAWATPLDAAQLFADVRQLATKEERMRVAREIHDGIAQELAGMAMYLGPQLKKLEAEDRARIEPVRDDIIRIIQDLRNSIWELRTDVGPETSLIEALAAFIRRTTAASGLQVNTEFKEGLSRLSPSAETEVLSIAQEAIKNALRHSKASTLWVTLRVDPPGVLLRVQDDGTGRIDPTKWDSFGVKGMTERAERLGGGLVFRDRVGGGTVVELNVRNARL